MIYIATNKIPEDQCSPDLDSAVWPITFLENMLTALKGSQFYFYLLVEELMAPALGRGLWVHTTKHS